MTDRNVSTQQLEQFSLEKSSAISEVKGRFQGTRQLQKQKQRATNMESGEINIRRVSIYLPI